MKNLILIFTFEELTRKINLFSLVPTCPIHLSYDYRRGASFKFAKLKEKNQEKISVNHNFCSKNREKDTSSSAHKYL
jgi:hypothetical protein